MKWGGGFDGQFWSLFLKNVLTFAILQLLGRELSLVERLQSCEIGPAKISAPSFRNFRDKLTMPAALDEFKSFNIFSKFTPLCLISSW